MGFMYQNLFFKKINFVNYSSMTYYTKPNFIEYDEWFDENIDPLDLKYYFDEKKYSNTVHEKFYDLSSKKLVIGSSDKFIELN